MFNEIVEIAHERVVTAEDFVPFIGEHNSLAFCKGEPLGNVSSYPDADILSGIVYRFRLIGAYPNRVPHGYAKQFGLKTGWVMIAIEGVHETEQFMAMEADELAIRMDES